ncbi:MAG: nucleotidyltransferase family protein [Roseiarcus sp.]|jgi:molybdenum cofactor cytidylyltransferase
MSEIGAVILAAGRSARFRAEGGREISKLVALLDGKPLARHAAEAALASRARPVVVVTGFARGAVEAALAGLPLAFVDNPDFASGMASSLKAGVAALPADVAGALIVLGDMPRIEGATLDRLIEVFAARPLALAAAPVHAGRRGNPVLLSRALFPALARLDGEEGARRLLGEADPRDVVEAQVESDGVTFDIDTPGELAAARGLRG